MDYPDRLAARPTRPIVPMMVDLPPSTPPSMMRVRKAGPHAHATKLCQQPDRRPNQCDRPAGILRRTNGTVHWSQTSVFFLVLLGFICSLTAWVIDEGAMLLSHAITASTMLHDSPLAKFLCYTAARVCIVTSGVIFVHFVAVEAQGSGIPEMRTILNGFDWNGGLGSDCLHVRTLIAKVVGLTLALGGGLRVGKEGPFVHISCVLAYQMLTSFQGHFRAIRASHELSHHALSAACAVGVASTFGAPVGGVLFSIEVTSSFYKSSMYWKAFLCAISGCMVFKVLGFVGISRMKAGDAIFATSFGSKPFYRWEIPAFIALACLCGALGAAFTRLFSFVSRLQRDEKLNPFRCCGVAPGGLASGLLWSILMTVTVSSVEFFTGGFMTLGMGSCMDDLFHSGRLNDGASLNHAHWGEPSLHGNLAMFFVSSFVFSAAAIALPIPSGCVMPTFVVGAGLGRLFGELFDKHYSSGQHNIGITAGGYAVVGAAAFCAAVTDTISAAVIVFEFTGQLHYSAPILIAVLVSRTTCRAMGNGSLFDAITQRKRLPVWPKMLRESSYQLIAGDVMTPVGESHRASGSFAAKDSTSTAQQRDLCHSQSLPLPVQRSLSQERGGSIGSSSVHIGSSDSQVKGNHDSGMGEPSALTSSISGNTQLSPPVATNMPAGVVCRHTTLEQLQYALESTTAATQYFALVDDAHTMLLLGVVERRQLAALVLRWSECAQLPTGTTPGVGDDNAGTVRQPLEIDVASDGDDIKDTDRLVHGEEEDVEDDPLDSEYFFTHALSQPHALKVLGAHTGTVSALDVLSHGFIELCDSSQLCVRHRTPLSHVFFLFSVHKCMTVFVQRHGILVGFIKLADVDAYSSTDW